MNSDNLKIAISKIIQNTISCRQRGKQIGSEVIAVIDIGASKSHLGIFNLEGKLIEENFFEGMNFLNTKKTKFIQKIKSYLDTSELQIHYICVGAAGLSAKDDQLWVKKKLEEMFNAFFIVRSDAELMLWAALTKKKGVVLAIGTGSIIIGRKDDKYHFCYGGFGYLFDCFSGGFSLGQLAIKNLVEQIEKQTINNEFRHYLFPNISDTELSLEIKKIYRTTEMIPRIASFAQIILDLAERKNGIALKVLNQWLISLKLYLNSFYEIHPLKKYPLYISGGICSHSFAKDIIYSELTENVISEIRFAKNTPTYGGYLLTKESFKL